jgi:hypothetical protein
MLVCLICMPDVCRGNTCFLYGPAIVYATYSLRLFLTKNYYYIPSHSMRLSTCFTLIASIVAYLF